MITLICGPMYSGKSTALLQRMERSLYANRTIFVIRPQKDNRNYLTHNDKEDPITILNNKFSGKMLETRENEINDDVLELARAFDEIFIDEYFMIKNCKRLFEIYKKNSLVKNIYFAGLLASSENKLFNETIEILPYCDKIKKLNGVCTNCGSEEGNFSVYIGKTEKEGDILVGDNDYVCRCFECMKDRKDDRVGN